MKKQFVTILLSFVLKSHCGQFFGHEGGGDPFIAEVNSINFRFPFGEKLQEVDPIITTEDGDSDYHKDRKSVESRRQPFRPAWFDIGNFGSGNKVTDRFKVEQKTKERLTKKQENPATETEKSFIIFATPVPLKSGRRKDFQKYLTTKRPITTTPKHEEATLKGWETPFGIYENQLVSLYNQNDGQLPCT